jgi:hypothetical protein
MALRQQAGQRQTNLVFFAQDNAADLIYDFIKVHFFPK